MLDLVGEERGEQSSEAETGEEGVAMFERLPILLLKDLAHHFATLHKYNILGIDLIDAGHVPRRALKEAQRAVT